MTMNIKHIIYGFAAMTVALLSASCSNIDEGQRLIYVKPAEAKRAVLIEDYTGQNCTNCPHATEEIESLMNEYGADNIIAVGIHCGLGISVDDKTKVGLMTETGKEYANAVGVSAQPIGNVNRMTGLIDKDYWGVAVRKVLTEYAVAPMSLNVTNSYNDSNRKLTVSVEASAIESDIKGKLQVWLVEDNIVAPQIMPTDDPDWKGKNNPNYVHNHVFRAAVTGTWVTDFSLEKEQGSNSEYPYTLPSNWNENNVSVVAFVYNDEGVQQVVRVPVIAKDAE